MGECSARRGHYYAGPGNSFWQLLHSAGFTAARLEPEDDVRLPELGIGLTDLVKDSTGDPVRRPHFDVASLMAKVEAHQPAWVALTGKVAGQAVARFLGVSKPALGPQSWTIAGSQVFVLPSSSGANRRKEYDGRPTRLEWWSDLAQLTRRRPPLR